MVTKYKPLIALALWLAMVGIQAGWPHAPWVSQVAIAITAALAALHFTAPTPTTPTAQEGNDAA